MIIFSRMSCIVKVTRNFQVTIPVDVRNKLGLKEGDFVRIVYDEEEKVAKIIPLERRRRIVVRLGRKITVEEIERIIEDVLDEATS